MPRVNIYLPDDLAEQAKLAGMNVSQVAQDALREQLRRQRMSDWVGRVSKRPPTGVSHNQVIGALHAVRENMGTRNA